MIGVRTEQCETVDWLEEFLGPGFEKTSAAASCHVELRCGLGAYAGWRAGATAERDRIECFTLDSSRDLWALARGADGEPWAHDDRTEVAMHVGTGSGSHRCLQIVAGAEDIFAITARQAGE